MGTPALVAIHVRLWADDLKLLKKLAAERRMPYQVELRQLVRRALRDEKREVLILTEGEHKA